MNAAIALAVIAAAAPSTVTQDLPDADRATLVGCWTSRDHETWTFRTHGDHGLEVERDSRDSHRRGTASAVMYAPKTGSFAFATAGRIHGLMMIFRIDHGRIDASVFSKHDERGYFFTGNNLALARCPRR
jgi:hypothetical protein